MQVMAIHQGETWMVTLKSFSLVFGRWVPYIITLPGFWAEFINYALAFCEVFRISTFRISESSADNEQSTKMVWAGKECGVWYELARS
jgi:hypothetical protein